LYFELETLSATDSTSVTSAGQGQLERLYLSDHGLHCLIFS
jgi:hypothetical protein